MKILLIIVLIGIFALFAGVAASAIEHLLSRREE